MKKILLVLLGLTLMSGCGYKKTNLYGESNHWIGEYSVVSLNGNISGEIDFQYKNGDSNTHFNYLNLHCWGANKDLAIGEEIRGNGYTGALIRYPFNDRDLAKGNVPVTCTIQWDDNAEEKVTLTKKK